MSRRIAAIRRSRKNRSPRRTSFCPTCGSYAYGSTVVARVKHGRSYVYAGGDWMGRRWSGSRVRPERPIRVYWPQHKTRKGVAFASCPDPFHKAPAHWHRSHIPKDPDPPSVPPIDPPVAAEFDIRRHRKTLRQRQLQGKDRR